MIGADFLPFFYVFNEKRPFFASIFYIAVILHENKRKIYKKY